MERNVIVRPVRADRLSLGDRILFPDIYGCEAEVRIDSLRWETHEDVEVVGQWVGQSGRTVRFTTSAGNDMRVVEHFGEGR